MTTKSNADSAAQLDALIDADLRALLEQSDESVLAEAAELYGDAAKAAADIRMKIQAAVTEAGRRRLAEARKVIEAERPVGGNVLQWPLDRKRDLLSRLRRANTGLTMAARQGEDETENDLDSLIEDLVDLGVIDEEGNPR
jgi:hypothetical protein